MTVYAERKFPYEPTPPVLVLVAENIPAPTGLFGVRALFVSVITLPVRLITCAETTGVAKSAIKTVKLISTCFIRLHPFVLVNTMPLADTNKEDRVS
ncbi:hypothetical protein GCM10007862_17550 [Dyella lipolytica]|nr:hypothetical protein GCM10007862_17550 [Dyella lipolytica]